jgi:hypothetical protein
MHSEGKAAANEPPRGKKYLRVRKYLRVTQAVFIVVGAMVGAGSLGQVWPRAAALGRQ